MSKLIESILENNLVEANDHFEQTINQIVEQKLYERKRFVAAQINEEQEPYISPRTLEKIEQLKKGKKGFRGLAADVLSRAAEARKKFIKKPKATPRDPSAISPKKPKEIGGNAPSAIMQRVKAHAKGALERSDAERAQKSAWERSVGGKVAKVAKPVLKGVGQVVAGMMQGAE